MPPASIPACRLPTERVHRIVSEAVELEREFCCDALSVALVGMNAGLMAQVGVWVGGGKGGAGGRCG